jgi:hypothetical protein
LKHLINLLINHEISNILIIVCTKVIIYIFICIIPLLSDWNVADCHFIFADGE